MSGSAFVVVPVHTGGAEQSQQNPAELASALQQTINKSRSSDEEQRGPLKELKAHKDSLYKYINWEDPNRTLGAYFSALTVLLGLHYLPLTQFAVKAGAVILGTIFLTKFISRQFGSDTFLLRLRPKEYKTVPEPTLNATLKDIHDFVQYVVVQFQKIIYGEDLGKTFAACVSFITMYWLMKVASPFMLAVLGLTSLYIAPLVSSSHGRAVAQDATARGKELANTAAEKGKTLAEEGKSRAAESSSKTHDTSQGVQQHLGDLTERGKRKANNISGQAAAEISGKLGNIGIDAGNEAPNIAKPRIDDARQDNYRTSSSILGDGPDNYIYDTDGVTKNVSQFSDGTSDVPRRMAPHSNTINTTNHHNSPLDNRERIVSFR